MPEPRVSSKAKGESRPMVTVAEPHASAATCHEMAAKLHHHAAKHHAEGDHHQAGQCAAAAQVQGERAMRHAEKCCQYHTGSTETN